MATLHEALERWPGASAEWNGLQMHVGREDEVCDGEVWEGYGYTVRRAESGTLVATGSADDVDALMASLSMLPVGISATYDGWYWVDAYRRRRE